MNPWRYLIIVIVTVLPITGLAYSLSFTTSGQSISANLISEAITVSTGEAVGVTSDLYLTSSSATGEFSSSATNWLAVNKLTWNSNWSNRTFYYRDSSSGTFTLTAKLDVGRPPSVSYTANQSIVVSGSGESAPPPISTSTSETGQVAGVSTAQTSVSFQTGTGVSGMEEESGNFNLDIGKNRSSMVGVPVYFTSEISPKSYENKLRITWSFGDGTVGEGSAVHHAYTLPGTYVVSARAREGDEFARARSIVKIDTLGLEIESVKTGSDGAIILFNHGTDSSLQNFSLTKGGQVFIFPEDFYILANGSVALSARVTGIIVDQDDSLELRNANGQIIQTFTPDLPSSIPEVIEVSEAPEQLPVPELIETKVQARAQVQAVPVANVVSKNTIVIERKISVMNKILALPRLLIASIYNAF